MSYCVQEKDGEDYFLVTVKQLSAHGNAPTFSTYSHIVSVLSDLLVHKLVHAVEPVLSSAVFAAPA